MLHVPGPALVGRIVRRFFTAHTVSKFSRISPSRSRIFVDQK
jgi:hypothetical protein